MSKLFISICVYLTAVSAAPIGSNFVSWESEPDGRGTWSILSSCVLTLVLCVYTAVHMNIPAASQTPRQRRKHIAGWVCAGIFAPELVLWTAWQQWSEAKQLTQKIKEIGATWNKDIENQSVRPLLEPLLESWTMKHSFFVIMGGYQFRPEVLAKWFTDERQFTGWRYLLFIDKQQPKSVLTSTGFIELLKHGKGHKLPVLSEQDINDRSKADQLAKLVSCAQGFWLLIQIISRLASNLTITELEVNTLAHVICAVAMYAFWIQKPLNIEQPVWLENDYLQEWAFVIRSMPDGIGTFWSKHREHVQNRSVTSVHEPRITTHKFHPSLSPEDCEICRKNGLASGYQGSSTLVLTEDVTMSLKDIIQSLNSKPDEKFRFDFVSSYQNFHSGSDLSKFPHVMVSHGQLKAFLQFYGLPELDSWLDTWASKAFRPSTMLRRCPRMVASHYKDSPLTIGIMIMASSLYGGLHASLWQHHFPTVTELWMWRLSSLIVAGNGLFIALFVIFATVHDEYERKRRKGMQRVFGLHQIWWFCDLVLDFLKFIFNEDVHLTRYLMILNMLTLSVIQLVFVFCRVFLFIEAFVSLRSQPQDAYQTANWSQWLPHL